MKLLWSDLRTSTRDAFGHTITHSTPPLPQVVKKMNVGEN
jgi:hypothetical protein